MSNLGDLNIHELAAGPLLDLLVAEHVMGFDLHYPIPQTVYESLPAGDRPTKPEALLDPRTKAVYVFPGEWAPSTNADQALQALRHLQSEDWHVEARITGSRGSPEDLALWDVVLATGMGPHGSSTGYTFELAICRAALDYARSLGRGEK